MECGSHKMVPLAPREAEGSKHSSVVTRELWMGQQVLLERQDDALQTSTTALAALALAIYAISRYCCPRLSGHTWRLLLLANSNYLPGV